MAVYDREKDIQNLMKQDPELTRAQAETQVDRNRSLNQDLTAGFSGGSLDNALSGILKRVNINSLAAAGDNAKIAREATEGSKIGLKIGETAGGFQSLTVTTDEGETVTIEPTVAMMTNAIDGGGIKVTKTSGNKTEITTLTGKVTKDGFLKATVTQGSPKGMEEAIKTTVTADTNIISKLISQASINPTVAKEKVGKDVSEDVVKEVQKTNKKQNREIANPFAALSGELAGSAGNPFANILGNVTAVLTGALNKTSKVTATTNAVTTDKQSKFPDLPGDSKLKTINQIETTFAGLFPYPTPIIKQDGSTNVKEVIEEPFAKPSDVPVDIGGTPGGWKGYSTRPADFASVFNYVNTAEELETELRSAIVDRPLTAIVVGSTRTAKNEKYDAIINHKNSVKARTNWGETYQSWWNTYVGAPGHYYIHTDGSIQRGRPIRIRQTENKESYGGWVQRTIYVRFVGGLSIDAPYASFIDKQRYTDGTSYTPEQWKTFETICKVFRRVVPGGEAISWDELLDFKMAGFFARDWTKARFGWETLYVGDNDLASRFNNKLGPFEMEEISKYLPEKIAKATSTPIDTKPFPAPKPEKVADPKTGTTPEKTTEEKLSDEDKLSKVQKQIDKIEKNIDRLKDERSTLVDDRVKNATRITAIDAKISALRSQSINLEASANLLNTNIYPISLKKTEKVQLENAIKTGSAVIGEVEPKLIDLGTQIEKLLKIQDDRR